MTRRLFALAAVFALALPAAAAVVHRADETAVQGDVVAMEKGVVTLATRGADGTPQRVQIPLEDVVEINFDPSAAVPVQPAGPAVVAAASGVAPAAPVPSVAAAPPRPAGKPDAEGFVRIFNGKDLTGWDGDPRLWSVRDGVLVGEANAENPVSNSFLIWTGDEVGDFELRFSFRLPTGNSGMSFRSKIIDAVNWGVGGYSADIEISHENTGTIFDENGLMGEKAEIIVNQGEKVARSAADERTVEQFADRSDVRGAINRGDWNDYVVTAQGSHIVLEINGQRTAELTDERKNAPKTGVLAVQLYNTPARVELKDVRLKHLGKPPQPTQVAALAAMRNFPAAPVPPAGPRGGAKGTTAHFFNGQYWKSGNPLVAAAAAKRAAEVDGRPAPQQAPLVVSVAPDATAVLPTLNNDFGEAAPHPGINIDNISAAFTGRVRTNQAGMYTFVGSSDDDHWLFVDGKLVCSDPGPHAARDARQGAAPGSVVPIELAANTEYDFVFLVNEMAVGFVARAQWIPPGAQDPEDIPEDNLLAQTGPPAAPTDLRAEAAAKSVTLTFRDTATSELRYLVERAADEGFGDAKAVAQLPINADRFTDTQVSLGTDYYYRVRAVNFEGGSQPVTARVRTPGQAVAVAPAAAPPASAASAPPPRPKPAVAARPTPAKKEPGVSTRYYATQFWKSSDPRVIENEVTVIGEPDVATTVTNLTHEFQDGSPDPKLPNDHFSTIYYGKVRSNAAGRYLFLGYSDDDHYLYVDGKLVSVDTGAHGPRDPREGSNPDKVVPVELAANTEYDVLYLQNENTGGAAASVTWVQPGGDAPEEIAEANLLQVTGRPAAPSELAADGSAGNEVKLTFKDAATNEIRYSLERSADANFASQKVVNYLPINATGYTDAAVTKGNTYFYRLKAVNFDGVSDPVTVQVTAGEGAGHAIVASTLPPAAPVPAPAPAGATTAAATAPAAAQPAPAAAPAAFAGAKPDAEGFVSLFNGKDLTGWKGSKEQWRVEDGAITGSTAEADPHEASEYLVWDGGPVADFELRLKFKTANINSGVQFRSRVIDEKTFQVAGYQADIEDARPITGSIWDQGGPRGTVGPLGQKVTQAEGSRESEPLNTTTEQVLEAVKVGDWNEMSINAVGDTITVKVNGVESTVVVDRDPRAEKEGVIALQLDHYLPGSVQFKDIRLKLLGDKRPATAVAGAPAGAATPATAPAASRAAAPATAATAAPVGGPSAAQASKPDAENFVSLFNGKDLTGWNGDTTRWDVKDGAITGTVPEGETHNSSSTYLVWQGGELADFELRLRFKPASVNSGVQIRSKALNPTQVVGPQVDIADNSPVTGSIWDQGGQRGTIAGLGFLTTYGADGNKSVEPLQNPAGRPAEALKAGDWNEMSIKAVGNKTTVVVNGVTTSEMIDDDPRSSPTGVLALQLQLDPVLPGSIQFKDVRIKVPGGPQAPALAQAPASQPGPASGWTLILAGGDHLTGPVSRWTDKEVVVRTEAGEVAVPVRRLREAWRGGSDAAGQAKAQAGTQAAVPEDTAYVRADDNQTRAVRGVALGVEGDSFNFRFNDKDRKIALDRLAGVVFGEGEDEKTAAFDRSFHQSVLLASGDSLSGVWVGLAAGALKLRTPWDANVSIPLEKVTKLKSRNGRLVYLSDLTPARVEQVPYFDRLLPFQLDRSLTGGKLQLSDGPVERGIAVHSRTVLHYATGGAYQRLKGKVGFQEPEGKLGNAAVRILGDAKPLFERPEARGDQPPAEFDVDVSGVQTLTLEVDFGRDQDVSDRVVWANPRLLRADVKR